MVKFRSDRTDEGLAAGSRTVHVRAIEVVLAAGVALVIAVVLSRHTPSGPRSGSVRGITRAGFAACLSEAMLDSIQHGGAPNAANGCRALRGGVPAIVQQRLGARRLIQIAGDAEPVWTDSNALEQPR